MPAGDSLTAGRYASRPAAFRQASHLSNPDSSTGGGDAATTRLDVATVDVAIVGGGPAGLAAAERLAGHGLRVELFDAMPSVGRKFLLAGKGGLNLTHDEPFERFVTRYGAARAVLEPWLRRCGAAELRAWAQSLGIETFVGSSGRVFPVEMKAAPLLRRWLQRLRERGVRFHVRHRLTGLLPGAQSATRTPRLRFAVPEATRDVEARAVVLALGGASWPALGSDGAWAGMLRAAGVEVAALRPANCGFDLAPTLAAVGSGWSEHFRSRFAGAPLKGVRLHWRDLDGAARSQVGEFVITASGIEGSLVYAASASLRESIAREGAADVVLDLMPQRELEALAAALERPRGSKSLSTVLKSRFGLDGVRAALLRECVSREALADPRRLAAAIKALPLRLAAPRPLAEAISTAGGVRFDALDAQLMLRALPGVFCAGEMLDWEAPTGGYLLTGCFATGVAAAEGAASWLALEQGRARGAGPR